MARREGEVIEVLFDADKSVSPAEWADQTLEPSRSIPHPLNISLPFPRRCSTSSTISNASPIQLSPTLSSSPVSNIFERARNTNPRPTTSFLPCSRGLHAASLFLAGVPGAEDAVRYARDLAIKQTARELKLVKRWAPRTNVPKVMATVEWMGNVAEVTQTLQIQRLREEIEKAEKRAQTGISRSIRRCFA
ncbi:hypothetical protein N0V93_002383 [Gnomoniopsis smithogilvyi]|uniref:Uncharacterized protein n=1 Tax=Gnomoniopsis smithogilvyi TaxID=1191159 RepID=A0A9W9CY46_9PEZI|nr:hypothetical protein N0V93_002383 [Gnomoniopsis smithogilvyi]